MDSASIANDLMLCGIAILNLGFRVLQNIFFPKAILPRQQRDSHPQPLSS